MRSRNDIISGARVTKHNLYELKGLRNTRCGAIHILADVQATQPKIYYDESKDGGTTAREKTNNLIGKRYLQLGGRTVDDLLWGGPPLLNTCVTRRVTLCHSTLGDANRVPSGTTNKQPPPPPYMNQCKRSNRNKT